MQPRQPNDNQRNKMLITIGIIACTAVLIISLILLGRYLIDYALSKRMDAMLASQYHSQEAQNALPAVEAPLSQPILDPNRTADVLPIDTPNVAAAAIGPRATYDPFGGYPGNPTRQVAEKFIGLQKTNKDICAWVSIDTVLDQAVVQRDNEYYLRRDYTGQANTNGAIFLDEAVKLTQRPTCYILYGHNMKTGAMFGMLHHYETLAYLRQHPIVTFDTMYEDGEFAIFAVGRVSITGGTSAFVDYYHLPKADTVNRERIISLLKKNSDFRIPLEIDTDDQLLILVTCTGDDTERRFVAARRLRDGENAKSLNMTYLLAE